MANILTLPGFRPCIDGFFGRKQTLEDLKSRAETKGLTFIVGPPRRGKTRLMFELARYLEGKDDFLYSYYELETASANPFHHCVERLFQNHIRNAPNLEKAKRFALSQYEKVKKTTGVVLKVMGSADPTGAGSLAEIGVGQMLSESASQSLTLRPLPYETIRDTVNDIFKESNKKIVLFLDQWETGENNEENRNILRSFLKDPYNWPDTHIFVNLRPDNNAHQYCKELTLEYSHAVQIIEPAPLNIDGQEEQDRLLDLLRQEVPLTLQIDNVSLLKAIALTPMVIDRILEDKGFADLEGLKETIKGAVEGTYIDIVKSIDKLGDNHRRLLIFLSLLPELNPESWEKLKSLGEDFPCPPEYLDHLRQQGILSNINPPQAVHATAWETILKHLKTHAQATTLDLGYKLAQTLACKISKVIEEERVYVTSLQEVIKNLQPEASEPWLEALDATALGLTGQRIAGKQATLSLGVEWALKNNRQILPFLSMGLCNMTADAELDERREAVSAIRKLYKLDEDNITIRERLAKGLYNITVVAELDERREAVSAIRKLYKLDEDNITIREPLATGLYNMTVGAELEEKRAAVSAIRKLYELDEDNITVREQLARALVNLMAGAELEETRTAVSAIRELYELDEDNITIRERLALGLANSTVDAELEEKRAAVSAIRKLYELDEDNITIRERLAMGLCNMTVGAELEEAREAVSAIRELYKLDEDNITIREYLAKGLYNMTVVAKLDERREAVSAIRKLYKLDEDIIAIREQLAKGLYNMTVGAELDEKREAVLKELSGLRDRWPEDEVWELDAWDQIFS
jgi:hypothetical protein